MGKPLLHSDTRSGLDRNAQRTSILKRLAHACLLLTVFAVLRSVPAQIVNRPELEFQVKAAYLYKFGSYVEWPERAFTGIDSPLMIGVIGADPVAEELAQMATGRTINGREVIVRKLRHEDRFTGINVLFIGRSSEARLADILNTIKGQPMLTVTETEQALVTGSMINFVIVNGKVRFEVAPKAAVLGNLNISARLLAAAYKVASGAS